MPAERRDVAPTAQTATTRRSGPRAAAGERPRAPVDNVLGSVNAGEQPWPWPLPACGGARGIRTPAEERPRPSPLSTVRDTLPLHAPLLDHRVSRVTGQARA